MPSDKPLYKLYQFHQQGVQAFSVQSVNFGQQDVQVDAAPTEIRSDAQWLIESSANGHSFGLIDES